MELRCITILWAGLLLLIDMKPGNFFDDSALNQGNHIPWRDLPNWEDGMGKLLAGIWEHSRSAAQQHAPTANDDTTPLNYTATIIAEVARAPGLDDYPLWRVGSLQGELTSFGFNKKLKQSSS